MSQFSDGQLQISDRGNYGCLKFHFLCKLSPNRDFLAFNVAFLDKIFSTTRESSENFPTAPNFFTLSLPGSCHVATAELDLCEYM